MMRAGPRVRVGDISGLRHLQSSILAWNDALRVFSPERIAAPAKRILMTIPTRKWEERIYAQLALSCSSCPYPKRASVARKVSEWVQPQIGGTSRSAVTTTEVVVDNLSICVRCTRAFASVTLVLSTFSLPVLSLLSNVRYLRFRSTVQRFNYSNEDVRHVPHRAINTTYTAS